MRGRLGHGRRFCLFQEDATRSRRRAQPYSTLAGVLWGTVFPVFKVAQRGFSPLHVAVLRAAIGSPCLSLFCTALGHRQVFCVDRGVIPRLFVLALAGPGVFWPIQALSAAYSSAANAASSWAPILYWLPCRHQFC
jgi:drug/metabolite transporter (DMT)-like permease